MCIFLYQKARSKLCRADVPQCQLLLFYVPCQQGVVVYKLLISFQYFFANPSKPADALFCQFTYVISKPKKPEAWNREPSGETNRKFRTSTRVRTCGRADVRTPDTPASGYDRRSPAAAGHASRRPPCRLIFKKNLFLFSFFLGIHGNSHRHQQTTCCYTRT